MIAIKNKLVLTAGKALLFVSTIGMGLTTTGCYKEYGPTDGQLITAGGSSGSDTVGTNPDGSPSTNVPAPVSSPSPKPSSTPTPKPTSTPTGSYYTGPSSVAKYVNKFVDDAKGEGVNVIPQTKNPTLVIKIASLSSYGTSTIGLCSRSSTKREVTLNTTWWNNASETSREILMHHELGHCVLKRGHTSAKLSSGAMASIMTPYILGASTYNNNQRYYIGELFANHSMSMASGGGIAAADVDADNSHTITNADGSITEICDQNDLFPEGE